MIMQMQPVAYVIDALLEREFALLRVGRRTALQPAHKKLPD